MSLLTIVAVFDAEICPWRNKWDLWKTSALFNVVLPDIQIDFPG